MADKINRNAPCPCGSGKKYKQCCLGKDQSPRHARVILAHHLAERQSAADVADERAAYEAAFDEIETATAALDAHRAVFEKMLQNPQTIADRARNLFAEPGFESFHYTADDVDRACAATAYAAPPAPEAPDYGQFLNIATVYLTDTKNRLGLARELLKMLPDNVTQERFLDAWLLQFCAHHLAETPTETNPFLVEMFKYGLTEWQNKVAVP
jgi:hypothetical protein